MIRETSVDDWKLVSDVAGPTQIDGDNCAIFVMMTTYCLSKGLSLDILSSSECRFYRNFIKVSILQADLEDFESFAAQQREITQQKAPKKRNKKTKR